MMKILLSIVLSLIAVGCGPRYVDYFPYHDDGRPKPKVVLLPVLDESTADLPWDVSQELTNSMRYEIMNNGELYLWSQEEVDKQIVTTGQVDFFTDESMLAQNFCGADFVILAEFLEQKDPCESGRLIQYAPCREVVIKTRIKIVDIRGNQPRIVQQEIFKNTYIVASEFDRRKAGNTVAGSAAYKETPIGSAHQRLVCDVVDRMEKVIKGA